MVGSDGEQTRGPFGLGTWDFGEILPARNVRVCEISNDPPELGA